MIGIVTHKKTNKNGLLWDMYHYAKRGENRQKQYKGGGANKVQMGWGKHWKKYMGGGRQFGPSEYSPNSSS